MFTSFFTRVRIFSILIVSLLLMGLWLVGEPAAEAEPEIAPGSGLVESAWAGAVTQQSVKVNAKLAQDSTTVRLLVSLNPNLSNALYSGYYTANTGTNNRVVSIPMSGLIPDRQYYYAIETGGVVDTAMIGRFRTFGTGAFSFTFAFSACAESGSNHGVFETLTNLNPLFFLHLGDMHYEGIAVNDRSLFRQAYDEVLSQPRQAGLYRNVPLAYIWDDHDFGPNNADASAPGREAARLTYQEYVPHYPLPAGSGNVPIYQAFTVGRVRIIMTDVRSERWPYYFPDSPDKTMLGVAQKAWFKQELLNANGVYPVIIWVNTIPWITDHDDGDGWGVYTYERVELANFIRDNNITELFMLSGDAHMVAIDNGSNSDFATGGGAGFPVMHAAALDQSGNVKGGPYSHGAIPGRGLYGVMTVTDNITYINIQWSGRDAGNHEIMYYTTNVTVPVTYDEFFFVPLLLKS
ncbi:MAG: alkaline phosphatase family protein [Chloroflexi bacterium]|nr:alkaline phosphatase family protein [Chloroflexota bacterium]MCI0580015.1 alkaline phosphatase family protein [Chloroflexota bacterium]MCI0648460.1 alkaline phosphatase family protein [Chloroflexota bacterium]MCI0726641.1 alkaline phosphatase family protein [Chloroflexota bacterium]